MNKIKSNLKSLNNSSNKQQSIWNLKNKFYPKQKADAPVAKYNLAGQIITNSEELKNVYLKHFVHRMRSRPIKPGMEQYKNEIENKFQHILKATEINSYPDWTLDDLNKVLKLLKRKQSPDTMNFTNELFCFNNIGNDLKLSILCNQMKISYISQNS